MLHPACFSAFDGIMVKHGTEKIKTVGHAYLAISGLPLPNHKHAANMINAAIEIHNFMLARNRKTKSRGSETFEVRIGGHTGPVVAGIVGVKNSPAILGAIPLTPPPEWSKTARRVKSIFRKPLMSW